MRGGSMSFIYEERRESMKRDTKEQAAAKADIGKLYDVLSSVANDFQSPHPKTIEAARIAIEKAIMCVENVARDAGVKID